MSGFHCPSCGACIGETADDHHRIGGVCPQCRRLFAIDMLAPSLDDYVADRVRGRARQVERLALARREVSA